MSTSRKGKSSSSVAAKRRASRVPIGDDEYRRKREANNLAVRKSRTKTREMLGENAAAVQKLEEENRMYQKYSRNLDEELQKLRSLLLQNSNKSLDPKHEPFEVDLTFLNDYRSIESEYKNDHDE